MSRRNPTIREMVAAHLAANGFDGLWQCGGECACEVDDLFPCGEPGEECLAGYLAPCTCGQGCGYHIGPVKGESS